MVGFSSIFLAQVLLCCFALRSAPHGKRGEHPLSSFLGSGFPCSGLKLFPSFLPCLERFSSWNYLVEFYLGAIGGHVSDIYLHLGPVHISAVTCALPSVAWPPLFFSAIMSPGSFETSSLLVSDVFLCIHPNVSGYCHTRCVAAS